MSTQLVLLSRLRPTDIINPATVSFLEKLSTEQIKSLVGVPQVWETDEGLLISDRNNRAAVLAKRGLTAIEVDYNHQRDLSEHFTDLLSEVIAKAKNLTNRGIYTPYDL